MKRIHVIAKQQAYLNNIIRQLEEVFGDICQLIPHTLQEVTSDVIVEEDIVIISKEMFKGILDPFIPESCPIIVAKREINIVGTQRIFDLPKGERILVISDSAEHAKETVKSLESIYFEHQYDFYQPNKQLPENIQWIVTPGERELVPSGFSNVIDIGPRGIAFQTVTSIAELLQMDTDQITLMNRFFKSHFGLMNNSTEIDNKIVVNKISHQNELPHGMALSSEKMQSMIRKIEEHGFLEESMMILEVYRHAKKNMKSLGRSKVKTKLSCNGVNLSDQQLRLRLEVMQNLGLLIARQGRGGTKISEKGEQFLKEFNQRNMAL